MDCWFYAYVSATQSINMNKLSDGGEYMTLVQFFMHDTNSVREIRMMHPDVPNLGGVHDPKLPILREIPEDEVKRQCQSKPNFRTSKTKMIQDGHHNPEVVKSSTDDVEDTELDAHD